jgi:hypothetical protein
LNTSPIPQSAKTLEYKGKNYEILKVPMEDGTIRELAIYKKMFGGSGGTPAIVEGTAIPVGEKVEKIYFNIALSGDEANKYLSQLTYIDIGIGVPLNMLYAQTNDGITGYFFVVFKMDIESYHIVLITDIANENIDGIFEEAKWRESSMVNVGGYKTHWTYGSIGFDSDLPVLTEFMGLPVGAENEKIKNVLSITPFGASGGTSNKPTAYTVSSVDELPSDAVDGSTAIVSNNDILGSWFLNNTINLYEFDWYFNFIIKAPNGQFEEFTNFWSESDILYYSSDSNELSSYNINGMASGSNTYNWSDYQYRLLTITEIDDAEAEDWIRANGKKLPSFYIRENGEWVYKGEVV